MCYKEENMKWKREKFYSICYIFETLSLYYAHPTIFQDYPFDIFRFHIFLIFILDTYIILDIPYIYKTVLYVFYMYWPNESFRFLYLLNMAQVEETERIFNAQPHQCQYDRNLGWNMVGILHISVYCNEHTPCFS